MIKTCNILAEGVDGQRQVEIFRPGTSKSEMVKTASPYLPQIQAYVDRLRPRPGSVYSLVNAIGSYEFWSSNINGDANPETYTAKYYPGGPKVYPQLINTGEVWGYETFHNAHPFTHHVNKDPAKALGVVELSVWNREMHRVELVVRLDRDKCHGPAAQRVLSKIDNGQLPDVSMGEKVPFDLCSVCTDWEMYDEALATFDPKMHRHPGIAALVWHKLREPIRGLSVKTDHYCSHLMKGMNRIMPDGRKTFAWNHWMRFFDISFVFIGAEKTAKMMSKLASPTAPTIFLAPPSGWPEFDNALEEVLTKTASVKVSAVKMAKDKRAAIEKRMPSDFEDTAVPLIERAEQDLPNDVLDCMGGAPFEDALSTPTMMGITLRPREFQRIVLVRVGRPELADELDRRGSVFGPVSDTRSPGEMSPGNISETLEKILRPFVEGRSCFGPVLRRRMIKITISGAPPVGPELEPENSPLLDKVSAAYNGYRDQVVEKVASLSSRLESFPDLVEKVAGLDVEDLFAGRTKTAGTDPRLLLGAIPATYLLSALARHKSKSDFRRGRETGTIVELLGEHPHLAASLVGVAALKASGSNLPDKVLAAALKAVG